MAAHCSAWLFSCLPCGDTLLWPLDEVDCAEASLHPPLQSLDLEQSLLQTGTAPGREEGMYTDAPGLQLQTPGDQELGRHSKLVFHDSLAGGHRRLDSATAAMHMMCKLNIAVCTLHSEALQQELGWQTLPVLHCNRAGGYRRRS